MNSYFATKKKWLLQAISSIIYIFFSFTLKIRKKQLKSKVNLAYTEDTSLILDQDKLDALVNADLAILKDIECEVLLKKENVTNYISLYDALALKLNITLKKIDAYAQLRAADLTDLNYVEIDINKYAINAVFSDFPGLDMEATITEHYIDIHSRLSSAILYPVSYTLLTIRDKIDIKTAISTPALTSIDTNPVLLNPIESYLHVGEADLTPTSFNLLEKDIDIHLAISEPDYENMTINIVVPREGIDMNAYLMSMQALALDLLTNKINLTANMENLDPEGFDINVWFSKINVNTHPELLAIKYARVPVRIRDRIGLYGGMGSADFEEASFNLILPTVDAHTTASLMEGLDYSLDISSKKLEIVTAADFADLDDYTITLDIKDSIYTTLKLSPAETSVLDTEPILLNQFTINTNIEDYEGLKLRPTIILDKYIEVNSRLSYADVSNLNYIEIIEDKSIDIEASLGAPALDDIYPNDLDVNNSLEAYLTFGLADFIATSLELEVRDIDLTAAITQPDFDETGFNIFVPNNVNIHVGLDTEDIPGMHMTIFVDKIEVDNNMDISVTKRLRGTNIKLYKEEVNMMFGSFPGLDMSGTILEHYINIYSALGEAELTDLNYIPVDLKKIDVDTVLDSSVISYLDTEPILIYKVDSSADLGEADLEESEVYVNVDKKVEVEAAGSFAPMDNLPTEPITLDKYALSANLEIWESGGMTVDIILDNYINLYAGLSSADFCDLNYVSIIRDKSINVVTQLSASELEALYPEYVGLDKISLPTYIALPELDETSVTVDLDKIGIYAAISEPDWAAMNINLVIPKDVDIDLTPYLYTSIPLYVDILTGKIEVRPNIEVVEEPGVEFVVTVGRIGTEAGSYLDVVTPTSGSVNLYNIGIDAAITEPDYMGNFDIELPKYSILANLTEPDYEEAKINIILPQISTNLDSYLVTALEYSPAVILKQIETTAALGNPDFEEITSQLEINRIYTYIASSELVSIQETSITLGNQYSNIGISLAFDFDGGMGFDIIVPNNIYEYVNANLISVISYTPENINLKKIDIYNGMAESSYTYIDIPDYIKIYDKEIYTIVDSSAPVDFDVSDILLPPKSMTTDFSSILAEPFNLEAKLIDKIGIYAFAELEVWQTIPFSFTLSVPKHDYVDTTSLDYLSLETIYLTDIVSDGKNITIDPTISSANAQLTDVSVIVNNNINILNKVGASRIRIFEDLDGLEFEDLDGLSFSDLYTIDIS